jgi:hypothetical protein
LRRALRKQQSPAPPKEWVSFSYPITFTPIAS